MRLKLKDRVHLLLDILAKDKGVGGASIKSPEATRVSRI